VASRLGVSSNGASLPRGTSATISKRLFLAVSRGRRTRDGCQKQSRTGTHGDLNPGPLARSSVTPEASILPLNYESCLLLAPAIHLHQHIATAGLSRSEHSTPEL
jgi:hypothetical protein